MKFIVCRGKHKIDQKVVTVTGGGSVPVEEKRMPEAETPTRLNSDL